MRPHRPATKFVDCTPAARPGADAELLIVEGDSALESVCAVRDPARQAVLAIQGKPMNAWKASATRVAQHLYFTRVVRALRGLAEAATVDGSSLQSLSVESLDTLAFARVLLLFDPDADGIHIGALMMLFFARWAPALVDAGRVRTARVPMFELADPDTGELRYAWTPQHLQTIEEQRNESQRNDANGSDRECGPLRTRRFRGLGSMPPAILRQYGVAPATRTETTLGRSDIAQILELFSLMPLQAE